MISANSKSELKQVIAGYRTDGKKIGFVPTMGALHDGHLSLVELAKQNADIVVVSIFVNPTQFGEGEDFDKYPRTIEDDLKKLEAVGVDVVYLPTKEDMYPDGFSLKISTGEIGQQLEGVTRPHFFDGVALVVTKLFMQVTPDVAVFGQKDFQQLHIIRKVVSDFDIPVEILGGNIIREEDGLAMSSRNRYLSEDERKIAVSLNKIMKDVIAKLRAENDFAEVLQWGQEELLKCGFSKVDYLEIRDAESLSRTNLLPARLLAAVYLGGVRLIDNMAVEEVV